MALPTVSGVGYIISDEIRSGFSQNGNAWAVFSVAMNKPEKNDDGTWVPTQDLKKKIILNAIVSGTTAEAFMQYVKPKTEVYIVGDIYTDVFTKDDGTEIIKTALDVRAFGIPFQRNKDGNNNSGGGKKPAAKRNAASDWD